MGTFLQHYDDDWETWLDLVDVCALKHRETLRLVLSQQVVEKTQVSINITLDYGEVPG